MVIKGSKLAKGFLTIDDLSGGQCFIFSDDCHEISATIYMTTTSCSYCDLESGDIFDSSDAINRPIEIVNATLVIDNE